MAETPTAAPKRRTRPVSALKKFTVVAGAVVARTGRKDESGKAEVVRLTRGQNIAVNPLNASIQALLRQGAVVEAGETPIPLTARRASQLMGAPDDPVAAPVDGVEPIDARVAAREGVLE